MKDARIERRSNYTIRGITSMVSFYAWLCPSIDGPTHHSSAKYGNDFFNIQTRSLSWSCRQWRPCIFRWWAVDHLALHVQFQFREIITQARIEDSEEKPLYSALCVFRRRQRYNRKLLLVVIDEIMSRKKYLKIKELNEKCVVLCSIAMCGSILQFDQPRHC